MWPNKAQKFIVSFLRYSLGYESPDKTIEMISVDLDWAEIIRLAEFHGISPVLHRSLIKNQDLQLPSSVERALAKAYIDNSATGLLYERALKEIIDYFNPKGLDFAVLKGLSLAALLYPEPEMRPVGGDVDILIQQGDYPKARLLLKEIGYELMNFHYEQHELDYIGEVKFIKFAAERALIVDLHTDFNANHWGKVSGFEIGGFWDNLLMVKHGNIDIPSLPVEAYLFFLSIHCAANHVFDRLITFCDIDLLVRKYVSEIEWTRVAEYAGSHGSRKTLYHTLSYCKQLLGTPVPNNFLKEIKPGFLSTALVPTRSLLLRNKKAPKSLERYMHLVLLDNPLNFFKSLMIFTKRILSENRIRKKTGAIL